jgi:malonyl-CoA O-methyltransferase
MQLEQQTLLELLPPLQGRVVLDLACGTGRWGKAAQTRGATVIVGLDNSLPMLQAGVLPWVAQADMTALPLGSESVYVVLCGLALGHLPGAAMRTALAEMGRVLKAGGMALLSDFHPCQAWQGARRTFRGADGKTYAVEHYVHSYADYHTAAQQAGLSVDAVREPSAPDLKGNAAPLVLVLRLIKPTRIPLRASV